MFTLCSRRPRRRCRPTRSRRTFLRRALRHPRSSRRRRNRFSPESKNRLKLGVATRRVRPFRDLVVRAGRTSRRASPRTLRSRPRALNRVTFRPQSRRTLRSLRPRRSRLTCPRRSRPCRRRLRRRFRRAPSVSKILRARARLPQSRRRRSNARAPIARRVGSAARETLKIATATRK